MMKKKLLLGAALGLMLGFSVHTAVQAADQDVDASITTRAAISLTKNFDMVFGSVDYDAVHSGTIRLATNGAVDLVGAAGLTMGGTPNAGDVSISGDGASNVEVSCETGGTLTDGGANTLTLSATEIVMDVGVGPALGTACAGLGVGPIVHTLDGTDKVLIGGSLDTTADAIDTSTGYSTGNVGGDPVTVRVVYQ